MHIIEGGHFVCVVAQMLTHPKSHIIYVLGGTSSSDLSYELI
jgi:hypothetical protein